MAVVCFTSLLCASRGLAWVWWYFVCCSFLRMASGGLFHVGCRFSGAAICYCDLGQGPKDEMVQQADLVAALFEHVNRADEGGYGGPLAMVTERFDTANEMKMLEKRQARLIMSFEENLYGYIPPAGVNFENTRKSLEDVPEKVEAPAPEGEPIPMLEEKKEIGTEAGDQSDPSKVDK